MKIYIFIAFLLVLILGLYFLNKADNKNDAYDIRISPEKVKKLNIKTKTNINISQVKESEVDKKHKNSMDDLYSLKMENYLEEDIILEDDDGTQWRSLKREWLLRLEKFLEVKLGSKNEAQKMLLKYFSINEQYQKDKDITKLFKQHDEASKKYLNLNRYGNISEAEKIETSKRYRELSKKLNKSRAKLVDQKKKLFGKYYNEVLKELDKYNDEITAKHNHLGYSIGIGL